jgi:hypothetical protein
MVALDIIGFTHAEGCFSFAIKPVAKSKLKSNLKLKSKLKSRTPPLAEGYKFTLKGCCNIRIY